MWLTQTYLRGPRDDFALYVYLLTDKYAQWNSPELQRVKGALAEYGRGSGPGVAIFAPEQDIDRRNTSLEFGRDYADLAMRCIPVLEFAGLLVTNKRLEDLRADGSNGRWAFFPFGRNLKLGASDMELEAFLKVSEGVPPDATDPVQDLAVLVAQEANSGRGVLDSVSVSLSGPSINVGRLLASLRDMRTCVSNIYE